MATAASSRRLLKEFQAIQAELNNPDRRGVNPDLIELRPWDADGEDLREWLAVIRGPPRGNYSGTYDLQLCLCCALRGHV